MQNICRVLIVILVIMALGVGYVIYPSQKTWLSASPSKISLDELRKIIASHNPNSSAYELQQYHINVGAFSVKSPVLDVSGCVATPNIMQIQFKKPFKISNKDTVARHIDYGKGLSVTVRAKTQKEVSLDFHGLGNYVLRCDQSSEFAGLLLVIP